MSKIDESFTKEKACDRRSLRPTAGLSAAHAAAERRIWCAQNAKQQKMTKPEAV